MKLFITGTDTEVGKTYISVGLLKAYKQIGLSTLGLKPIASGCVQKKNNYYNEDTTALHNASSIKLTTAETTPFMYEPAIAPHIATNLVNEELTLSTLQKKMHRSISTPADVCIIEGFGGWLAPLNYQETMAEYVIEQQLDVVLVVGIRLGCLNHSLLTYRAIQNDKVNIIGWIANCLDPNMLYADENIITLKNILPIPCLGIVKYGEDPMNLSIPLLINPNYFPKK